MIKRVKRFTGSQFVRSVAIVATGTVGAQVVNMAFSPLITRLYGPEAFGVLGTFMAILTVLIPLTALGYPIAIVLPKKDSDAATLIRLSFFISAGVALLTAFTFFLFKSHIVEILNIKDIESFLFLLPLAMFFSSSIIIISQWIIRKRLFKVTAKITFLHALCLNIIKTGFGIISPYAIVLIFVTSLGSALHVIMLFFGVKRSIGSNLWLQTAKGRSSYKEIAWNHRDFPYYRTPQNVLNAASQNLPVLMLASFFGPSSAGFYALGKMVLAVPITLISKSVGMVLYPKINDAIIERKNPFKLLMSATFLLALLGLIPFGLIMAFGPYLFSTIFGNEWAMAGIYAQWLSLWLYFGFVNTPSVSAIPVLKIQKQFLIYEIISTGLRALVLVVGFIVFDSELWSIALFSIVSALLNLFLISSVLIRCLKIYSNG